MFLFFLLLFSSQVFADALVLTAEPSAWEVKKNHSFSLGVSTTEFDYKEDLILPLKSTEKGFIPGISIGYSFKEPNLRRFYLSVDMHSYTGDIRYDGSTQKGQPLVTQSGLSVLNLVGLSGLVLSQSSKHEFSFYSGIGVRIWDRLLAKYDPLHHYAEQYRTVYLPIGLNLKYSLSEKFAFTLNTAVHVPMQSKFLVTLGGAFLENELHTKLGWKFQMPLQYRISPVLQFSLTPSLEVVSYDWSYIGLVSGWSDRRAPTGEKIMEWKHLAEPASMTYHYGVTLGATFFL